MRLIRDLLDFVELIALAIYIEVVFLIDFGFKSCAVRKDRQKVKTTGGRK